MLEMHLSHSRLFCPLKPRKLTLDRIKDTNNADGVSCIDIHLLQDRSEIESYPILRDSHIFPSSVLPLPWYSSSPPY